jgi:hypothetical protein
VRFGVVAQFSLALALCGASGCTGRAKTPAAALERLNAAVASRDARQLYAALDLETRWSWMTVRRAHREAYDIVLSNVPEGPGRDQELRRFEAAALAENEAALFAEVFPAARWDELKRDLATGTALQPEGDALALLPLAVAVTAAPAKAPGKGESKPAAKAERALQFRRGPDGSWGFAGMAAEAEERKRRATADLDLVRTNAADLERAAIRAGR